MINFTVYSADCVGNSGNLTMTGAYSLIPAKRNPLR